MLAALLRNLIWGKWLQRDFENVQQEKGVGIPGSWGKQEELVANLRVVREVGSECQCGTCRRISPLE